MKTRTALVLVLCILMCSYTGKQAKKKIILFGDSITQMGAGPGGYIRLMDTILQKKGRDNNYEFVGAGIGGNKVYDLYLRMETDVLDKKPDAVVIFIGVNDVWHKKLLGTGTDADKFEQFYNAIIKKLKERKIAVYMCTPAAIGEKWDCTNSLDGELNSYSEIVRKIARQNNCPLIDLRRKFLDYLKANNTENKDKGILTTDGVHLNAKGNQFVAQEIYNSLALDFIR